MPERVRLVPQADTKVGGELEIEQSLSSPIAGHSASARTYASEGPLIMSEFHTHTAAVVFELQLLYSDDGGASRELQLFARTHYEIS